MEKFQTLTSTYVPLPIENVDTDQIIPARFLKATTREGFGDYLFADWRYDKSGKPNSDFVLNDPTYNGRILVAGFKVIVSSFFADIFKNNALNNGILPVVVSEDFLNDLFDCVKNNPKATITVDLEKQILTNNENGKTETFEINAYKKECLLKGLDDIDFLLSNKDKIEAYEKNRIFKY